MLMLVLVPPVLLTTLMTGGQALATLAKRTKKTSNAGFAIIVYVDLYSYS